jgi:hypothetical protein
VHRGCVPCVADHATQCPLPTKPAKKTSALRRLYDAALRLYSRVNDEEGENAWLNMVWRTCA